jgi:hypothetical protein
MPPRRAPAKVEEPLEIEEPDLVEDDEEEEPEEGSGLRVSVNSWWCPEDDTSMPHSMKTCPKCGFIRP